MLGWGLVGAGVGLAIWSASRSGGLRLEGGTRLVSGLSSAAFPRQDAPAALVHVPAGYDASRPLDLVLYLRGLGSCVAAVAASEATPCRPGGAVHRGSRVVESFDLARVNAVLVVPELQVESSATDPGALGEAGGLARLLGELLGGALGELFGAPHGVEAVRSVLLVAHSGGWAAAAAMVARGGAPVVGVSLLDALYGGTADFRRFALRVGRGELGARGRFSSVYTGGAPEAASVALAGELRAALGSGAVRVDTSTADLSPADFAAPLYFRRLRAEHSRVPELALRAMLEGAGLDGLDV